MISNSGHDEHGRYHGGQAGDQNGEWVIQNWYNRPWNCILRYPVASVRKKIAELARKAANNNKIGYDQYQRMTYWTQLQKANYDPSKIKVACEADCSAGVIANVWAVGHIFNIGALKNISATYTGNMRSAFKAAGFEVLTASKYLTSDKYLLEGDILLNDAHHTATNLDDGSAVTPSTTPAKKSVSEIAKEVIAGKWGNGTTRVSKLKAAGYDPTAVQKEVDKLLAPSDSTAKKSVAEIAKEVIAGKWGNGAVRTAKLKAAGYNAVEVQKEVDKMLTPAKPKNPYATPTVNVKKGSKGNNVRWVQWELKRLGYDLGEDGIDGDFGSVTDKAVRAFQKKHKLTVDGVVGKNTRAALKAS